MIISRLRILESRLYPMKKVLLHSTTAIHLMSSSASMVEQQQDDKKYGKEESRGVYNI